MSEPIDNVTEMKLPKTDQGNDPADNHDNAEYENEVVSAFKDKADELEQKRKARSPFVLARDFDLSKGTKYLIDDWWVDEGVTLLYAPKDSYKSFVTVDWACSVASGVAWNGSDVKKQGPILYIAGEGNMGIQRRIAGWCMNHELDYRDLPIALSRVPMQVLDVNSIQSWQVHAQAIVDQVGPLAGIVIDTLSSNFGPGDENHPSDMARFLSNIKIYLTGYFNCPGLVVHHTGKDIDKGPRGGSSLAANSEEVYTLQRVDDAGKKVKADAEDAGTVVQLIAKHVKDREKPPITALKAHVQPLGVVDGNGKPMTTLVMRPWLTEVETQVRNYTMQGKSSREIAELIGGLHYSSVNRTQVRLRKTGAIRV